MNRKDFWNLLNSGNQRQAHQLDKEFGPLTLEVIEGDYCEFSPAPKVHEPFTAYECYWISRR